MPRCRPGGCHRRPLTYLPTLSRPDRAENAGWSGHAGRLTDTLPRRLSACAAQPSDTVAYLCGNPAVVDGLGRALSRFGLADGAIRREEYRPAG